MAIDYTRIRVKQYLKQLLKERMTLALNNVGLNRPINYDSQNTPEIRILSLNSVSTPRDDAPRIYKIQYFIGIELSYTPKAEDYDDEEETFEMLISQVEDAIESDEFLQNESIRNMVGEFCVEKTYLNSIEYRTESDGAKPVYTATISYEVCYNKRTGAPTDELPDLEKIHRESTPGTGTSDTPSIDSEVTL